MFDQSKGLNCRSCAKLSFIVGFIYCAILLFFAIIQPILAILGEFGLLYQQNPVDDDNYTLIGLVVILSSAFATLAIYYAGLAFTSIGLISGFFGLRSDKNKFAKIGIALSLLGFVATLMILAFFKQI